MADLSRRAACVAALATAAASALPISVMGQTDMLVSCSPQFREWYDLVITQYRQAVDSDEDEPYGSWCDRTRAIEDRILAQEVNGLADARVVAEIAMVALFWVDKGPDGGNDEEFRLGHDDELDTWYRDERSRARLIQAAARLFLGKGGANA